MNRLPSLVASPRLALRLWTEDDAVALNAAVEASLDHLRPWMAWAAAGVPSLSDRLAHVQRSRAMWESGGDSDLGIFRHDIVVGGIGLHRRVGPGGVEIGYWIHTDHVRHGYATEAAGALTSAAFRLLDIERIEIRHDKANVASSGVPRKLGFDLIDEVTVEVEAPAELGVECRWVVTRSQWMTRSSMLPS